MLLSLVSLVQRREHMRKHGGVLAARSADCDSLAAVQQPLVHYDPIDLLLERLEEAVLAELRQSTATVTDPAQSGCAGAAALLRCLSARTMNVTASLLPGGMVALTREPEAARRSTALFVLHAVHNLTGMRTGRNGLPLPAVFPEPKSNPRLPGNLEEKRKMQNVSCVNADVHAFNGSMNSVVRASC